MLTLLVTVADKILELKAEFLYLGAFIIDLAFVINLADIINAINQ